MAKFEIHMKVIDGQTVSSFGKVKPRETIFFYNDDPSNTLTVAITSHSGPEAALCKPNQAEVSTFTVGPSSHKNYQICTEYKGKTFEYTATIGGSAAEDPIIIIEQSRGYESLALTLSIALGAAVAFAAGYFVGRMRRNRHAIAH
ncbi:MAG: hypothetical protein AB7G76_05785 [Steroidobacteraceae bacterium]